MLILSKFHDYYDHITAFGIDKTIVFNRVSKDVEIKGDNELPHSDSFQSKGWKYTAYYMVIGFCGKLYPFIKVNRWPAYGSSEESAKKYFMYSVVEVAVFLEKFGIPTAKKEKSRYYRHSKSYNFREPANLDEFFDSKKYQFLKLYFAQYEVPTFVWKFTAGYLNLHLRVTFNPNLRDYGFVKAVDPVTAFQELMYYISGVLACPAKPTVKLSDKEMAKKRGHDGKYSFRSPPQSSPKRPKNK